MFAKLFALKSSKTALITAAFIVSSSGVLLGGIANAHDPSEHQEGCSQVAHARNTAMHALKDGWRDAQHKLAKLAEDTRPKLRDISQEDARAVREVLRDTRRALDERRKDAKDEIQEIFEAQRDLLCADKDEDEGKTSNGTTPNTASPSPSASPSGSPGASTSGSPSSNVASTDLSAAYKDTVDKAVADMNAAVDQAAAKIKDLLSHAKPKATGKDTTAGERDEHAKEERKKAEERESEEHGKPTPKPSPKP